MNQTPFRPVTIATIVGKSNDLDAHFQLIEQLAAQHPDVIMLAENWAQQDMEEMESPIMRRLKKIAAAERVYILHATMLRDGDHLYNSALMIGRDGELVGRYDKLFPYYRAYSPEMENLRPRDFESVPGAWDQPLIECDFGKVAVRTCFDANFPEAWDSAAQQGAELVLWPSAYAAGRQLEAHALNHHYPIVTATTSGHCMVIDIDGRRIVDTHGANTSLTTQFVTLDLDRCIFHENFNEEKLDMLLSEKPLRIELERHCTEEQWFIVRSARQGISARKTCHDAGMEELRDYKKRSRRIINDLRPSIKAR